MKQPFENSLKCIFVVLCCTIVASFVQSSPLPLVGFGCVSLFALLVATLRMGHRGRQSASWLTLGFGSWTIAHLLLFLKVLLPRPLNEQGFWMSATIAIIILCSSMGMKAAIHGRWSVVLGWWVGSFIVFIPYLLWVVTPGS